MAYGNYGAFVFCNGKRMPQWEDQTPYRETELTSGYLQAFGRTDGIEPHHAVLGQQRVRLCSYKAHPHLYLDGAEVDLKQYVKEGLDLWDDDDADNWDLDGYDGVIDGEIEGYRFTASAFNGNMLDLRLVEPDGSTWTSRCGYCYGAGWMEDDEAVDEAKFFD